MPDPTCPECGEENSLRAIYETYGSDSVPVRFVEFGGRVVDWEADDESDYEQQDREFVEYRCDNCPFTADTVDEFRPDESEDE